MARAPIPADATAVIAARAVQLARENMARRGWSHRSQQALRPLSGDGRVGIATSVQYLMYQNKGIRPFLMTALEGKTVPIKGQLFRVRGVGQPGMGYQDRKNKTRYPHTGRIWRQQRWRHPGIDPGHFLENSISRAMLEHKATISRSVVGEIRRAVERPRPLPARPTPNLMPRRAGWSR